MTKINKIFTVILGDFNAKSRTWCASDKNMPEGIHI